MLSDERWDEMRDELYSDSVGALEKDRKRAMRFSWKRENELLTTTTKSNLIEQPNQSRSLSWQRIDSLAKLKKIDG